MASDAVIVSVASYPYSNGRLRPLPGTERDSRRVLGWLQTQGVAIDDFTWPLRVAAGAGSTYPWNALGIQAKLLQLLQSGLHKPRQRLFLYVSAHGRYVPGLPPMPAVYCASHQVDLPDMFLTGGWVPQLTAAPIYDEYLCFFDCCNEFQRGPLPMVHAYGLPERDQPPRVLVMAASERGQEALGTPTGGVFTDVLLEALSGSAGVPGATAVTAADVVAYVKENVPIVASRIKPGHVQKPVEWVDPASHVDLGSFVLFDRKRVDAVDASGLLAGRNAADVEVLDSDLEPVGALQRDAAGAYRLPSLFPGKYVLRGRNDGWGLTIRLKTTVHDDGHVEALAEPLAAP